MRRAALAALVLLVAGAPSCRSGKVSDGAPVYRRPFESRQSVAIAPESPPSRFPPASEGEPPDSQPSLSRCPSVPECENAPARALEGTGTGSGDSIECDANGCCRVHASGSISDDGRFDLCAWFERNWPWVAFGFGVCVAVVFGWRSGAGG